MNYHKESTTELYFKDEFIGSIRVDFPVEGKISVELKAVACLEDVHLSQALNYLEAYNLQIGLLLNFGARKLEFKRLRNSKYDPNRTPKV